MLCYARCTFEVAVTQQRGLPVAIAGYGVSRLQSRIRTFGSFTAGIHVRGPVEQLLLLNLLFYATQAAQLFAIIVLESSPSNYGTVLVLLFVLVNPFIWFVLRASLGQQVRLARNARRVLRTMCRAARVTEISISNRTRSGGRLLARELLRNYADRHALLDSFDGAHLRDLAWLPCYDRRDVLVIRELVGKISPESTPSVNAVRALAFTAHAAARMRPAAGDAAAQLSLDEWLRERNISLDTLVRASLTKQASDPCDSSDDVLPMAELRALGWMPAPGRSCALLAPLGALAVAAPVDGVWSLGNATPLPRPQFAVAANAFFGQIFLFGLVEGTISLAHTDNLLGDDAFALLRLLLALTSVCFLAIPAAVWAVDVANAKEGRFPLPLKIYYRVRASLAALGTTLIAGALLVLYAGANFRLYRRNATGTENSVISDRLSAAGFMITGLSASAFAAFFFYEANLYGFFMVSQVRHFFHVGSSQVVKLDAMPPRSRSKSAVSAGKLPRSVFKFMRRVGSFNQKKRAQIDDEGSRKLELKDLSELAPHEDVAFRHRHSGAVPASPRSECVSSIGSDAVYSPSALRLNCHSSADSIGTPFVLPASPSASPNATVAHAAPERILSGISDV